MSAPADVLEEMCQHAAFKYGASHTDCEDVVNETWNLAWKAALDAVIKESDWRHPEPINTGWLLDLRDEADDD